MSRSRDLRRHIVSTPCSRHLLAPAGARNGVAAVEVAIIFPLFVLLVAGAIDVGRAIMAQHTLVEAARAGCRLYCVSDELTEQDARAVLGKVMQNAKLDGYTVAFDPDSAAGIKHKAPVTVSVSIPYDRVAWSNFWFFSQRMLTGTCIMPGESVEVR